MKKRFNFLFAAILMTTSMALNAQNMTLDEILEAHFETINQDKLLEIDNMVQIGRALQMNMELPYKTVMQRPEKIYMEVEIQGARMQQAYNGETGWMIAPWTGTMEPQDLTGTQLKSFESQADMDGNLYNWEEKGHRVTLVGEEEMEGTPVYNIKLVHTNGDEYNYYMDAENFVVLKVKAKVKVEQGEVEGETYLSNYKPVEGIIMPFVIENRVNGQTQMQIVVDSVKFNTGIDESIFEKPEAEEMPTEEDQ